MSPAATDPTVWNLADLFRSVDDPQIDADLQELEQRAIAFRKEYHGKIGVVDVTAETLLAAMEEYEAILRASTRPSQYANLMFSADTSDAARGALLQRVSEADTAINTHLIFLDLEIGAIPQEAFDHIIQDESLAKFRHYLERERVFAKHRLTEPEETVLAEVSVTGSQAFCRLFSEITSRMMFEVERDGEVVQLNQSQTLTLLYEPDRDTRRAAATAITAGLQGTHHPLAFIFNTLLQHKSTMDRLRHHEYPEQSRHLDNDVDREVVQHVVDVTVANYDIVHDYYGLKRGLLGLDSLSHYDTYAPLSPSRQEIPWGEARSLVEQSFANFTPKLGDMLPPFFDRGWIDAPVRQGKQGGAFCSYSSPDLHPYVMMNYTGKPRDVMTLAHELGHAVHGLLAADHHALDFHASLPLAETASVFGEMLVFERLQEQLDDPQERLNLLAGKLEDSFATVFRQVSMFRFEQDCHRARREEGELPVERINELWKGNIQEMFGESLTLGDDYAWWWLYIPHIIHTPFYVYAYAFGELLVLSLYARYQKQGEDFIPDYLALLAAGGSKSPAAICENAGIDITQREFWQGGMDLLRAMVAQARELAGA